MGRSFKLVSDNEARRLVGHGFSVVGEDSNTLTCGGCGTRLESATDIVGGKESPACAICQHPLEWEEVRHLFRKRKSHKRNRATRQRHEMDRYFAHASTEMGDGHLPELD